MKALHLMVAFVFTGTGVFAQELPATDSAKYCQSIAGLMADGPIKELAQKNCMDAEADAGKKLSAHWGIVPAEAKRSCVSMLKLGASVSNQGLLGCAVLSVGAACMDGSLTCK